MHQVALRNISENGHILTGNGHGPHTGVWVLGGFLRTGLTKSTTFHRVCVGYHNFGEDEVKWHT